MRRRPAGFMLVEALVALVIASMTCAILWGLCFYDTKRVHASLGRLAAVRGAESILEHLKTDLRNLAPPEPSELVAWGRKPLRLERLGARDGADKVTFRRFVRDAAPGAPTELVSYRLDRGARTVLRDVQGNARPVGGCEVLDWILDYHADAPSPFLTYELSTASGPDSAFAVRGQIELVHKETQDAVSRWVSATGAGN